MAATGKSVEPSGLLRIDNLHVQLSSSAGPLHALRGVSLRIDRGETLCIVGESGCGKSMMALAVMGLLPSGARCTADRLQVGSADLLAAAPRAMADLRGNRMAMIFQEPMTSLNPCHRVGDQVVEALRRHRAGRRREAWHRAQEMFAMCGLPDPAAALLSYPHQLSGGMRQRAMIAMALICEPDLLIADEPTTALDVSTQLQILTLLRSLQERLGMGLLFITHDLGVVGHIADRVAVMYAGEIVEEARADRFFAGPAHPYARGLLDCVPVLSQQGVPQRLGHIPGTVPSLTADPPGGCAFAPRCTRVAPACASPVTMFATADRAVRCRFPIEYELATCS